MTRQRLTTRERKIWLSLGITLLGCGLLTGLALWIQFARNTDLNDPLVGVSANFKRSTPVNAPAIRFRDVALESGVIMRHGPGIRGRTLVEDTGSGVAWGDYDGDGDWDLYLVNFPGPLGDEPDAAGSNRLFQNQGGRFTDVTAAAGVGDLAGFGMGATFADYDGDGDADLYVTNRGPNRLYRNRGDGTFTDVAAAVGVDDPLWSTGVAWGDFDRDGKLDFYVCNYVDYDAGAMGPESTLETAAGDDAVPFTLNPNSFDPEPNRLFRNLGARGFADVAEISGVRNPEGRSLAATLCDLDGDGWLDIYVNNDVSTNRLYRNLGLALVSEEHSKGATPIRFVDLSAMTGTADPRGSMGLSVADLGAMTGSPDELPDLFITHWVAQENALYESVGQGVNDIEYRDRTRQLRLGEISIDTVGWGCAFVDLDLDGRVDLAVANGSTLEEKGNPTELIAEPQFLFWNDGQRFHDLAPEAGPALARHHRARGLAAADFDGDGDVDLAINVNRGQPLLLRNETELGHESLRIVLSGPAVACRGARVAVFVGGIKQLCWWGADVSFLGQHAPEWIVGLGRNREVDRLHVTWAGGRETELRGLQAGTVVVSYPNERSDR